MCIHTFERVHQQYMSNAYAHYMAYLICAELGKCEIKNRTPVKWGHTVARFVEALCYKPEGQFPMVSLEFFIDIILPAALWPWG